MLLSWSALGMGFWKFLSFTWYCHGSIFFIAHCADQKYVWHCFSIRVFYCQLLHKRTVFKGVIKFTLKLQQLQHVSVSSPSSGSVLCENHLSAYLFNTFLYIKLLCYMFGPHGPFQGFYSTTTNVYPPKVPRYNRLLLILAFFWLLNGGPCERNT